MTQRKPPIISALNTLMLSAILALGVSGCGVSTLNVPTTPLTSVYGDESSLGLPRAPVRPPWGLILTKYSAPLDYQFSKDGNPTPTGPTVTKGTSDSHFIMIWPLSRYLSGAIGESDFESAVENGNLNTVHYADYEYLNVLFIYTRTRVHVYGE